MRKIFQIMFVLKETPSEKKIQDGSVKYDLPVPRNSLLKWLKVEYFMKVLCYSMNGVNEVNEYGNILTRNLLTCHIWYVFIHQFLLVRRVAWFNIEL